MRKKRFAMQKLNMLIYVIVSMLLILGTQNGYATMHVVHFGGSLGVTYSPASFSANVGDTVQWVGDFSMHPISSVTIPANASSWHVATGSAFDYRIAVAGEYHYKCDLHVGAGMIGSFTVTAASGVVHDVSISSSGDENRIPRIVMDKSGQPYATFTLPKTGPVTLTIIDLRGRERATIVSGIVQAGRVTVSLGPTMQGAGAYCLRFTGNDRETSRIFIVR